MRALLQRVAHASVEVNALQTGAIGKGLLVFLGVERSDTKSHAQRLAERVLNYRIFPNDLGRMNLNVQQARGGVLVVSQFTLAADTRKGNRPGFSSAKPPEEARILYEVFVDHLKSLHEPIACGQFQADMQVSLQNDGPVTFLLEV